MQEIYVRSHYGWTITAYKYIVGYNELSLTCNIHYTYEGHAYSKLVLQVFGEIISKYSWRFNWQKNYGVKNETPLRIYAKEKSLNATYSQKTCQNMEVNVWINSNSQEQIDFASSICYYMLLRAVLRVCVCVCEINCVQYIQVLLK